VEALSAKSIDLRDAEPQPWKAEKKPDLTPTELKLGRAALNFAAAKHALEDYVRDNGAYGPRHQTLLQAYDTAWTSLLSVAWGFPQEPRNFGNDQ
jgi:hypothetical protein